MYGDQILQGYPLAGNPVEKSAEGLPQRPVTRRKLVMLDGARNLQDLQIPPANRLEALKGDRLGQYSIRVNDQFRLCFYWEDDGPHSVDFVDYH